MGLRVSTTGSDVALDDLGIHLTHPTTNYDLTEQFSALELKDSEHLLAAIQAGDLDVDDGTNFIHKDDYDPDETLLQQLGIDLDPLIVSHAELESIGQTYVKDGVFPLTNSSTAASTRNVYSVGGRWVTWRVEAGDRVLIGGNAAAGEYTVESVTDQQNFVVVESIVDSTGGTVEVLHPPGSTRVGVDNGSFTKIAGQNLQAALESIDSQLGGGSGSSTADIHLSYADYFSSTVPGVRVNEYTSWEKLAHFIFRGTTLLGTPSYVKLIGYVEGDPIDIRLVDVTNGGNVIASVEISALTETIYDMGTLSNLPTGEAVFEFQGKLQSRRDYGWLCSASVLF